MMSLFKNNIWLNTFKLRSKTPQQRFEFFFNPNTNLPTDNALIYLATCFIYLGLFGSCCIMLWLSRPEQVVVAFLESMIYVILCFCFVETLVQLLLAIFMPIAVPLYFANKCKNRQNYWLLIAAFCIFYLLLASFFSDDTKMVSDGTRMTFIPATWWDRITPYHNFHIFLLYFFVIIPFFLGFVSSSILYYCLKPANSDFDTDNLDGHLLDQKEENL